MQEFSLRLRFWRDHRWAPGRMSEYLDGELPASSRSRMERHVRECVECRRLVAGLSQVMDGLHRLPLPEGAGRAVQIAASVLSRLRKSPP